MFEIDDKLFGYISKSGDLTEDIVQRYKNSLIFIGDEKQIYVPTTNSYVGVGTSTLEEIRTSVSSSDKIYISDYANNSLADPNTTYYFPVIDNRLAHTYYHTYVALNVGVNPISGKFIGGLQGTADYATVSDLTYKITTKVSSENKSYYLPFVNQMAAESYAYTNNRLLYNPHQELLTSTYFTGTFLGHATSATYATYSTYTTYTSYSIFNSYQSTHRIDDNKIYNISFVGDDSYSLTYVDNSFYYNPYLNSAYAGHFYGTFHGDTDLFESISGGDILINGNVLIQENTYIKIGTKELGSGYSYQYIISYLDGDLSSTYENNLQMYVNINGIPITKDLTYLHATYLGNVTKEGLFTQFERGNLDSTRITIGGTTKDHYINASYLQGYHAENLFTYFESGTISSNGNILRQENSYITIGGTTYYANGGTCNIINSVDWSYTYSTTYSNTTYNLILRYNINGIDSTYTYIPKIYAYSATYIDGVGVDGLFTQFENGGIDETRITIGGTTKNHYVNAAYLQGYHVDKLFTNLDNDNKQLSISIGGTNKKLTIDYATESNYASYLKGPDNRNSNGAPQWYMLNKGTASLFGELCKSEGASQDMFEYRLTMTPYKDNTCGHPTQMAFNDNGAFLRTYHSDGAWNSWEHILTSGNSSVSGDGGSTWGSSITVKINNIEKTLTIPNNPNTDYRVNQLKVTDNKDYRLLFKYTNDNNDENNPVNFASTLYYNPSTKVLTNDGPIYIHNNSNTVLGINTTNYKIAHFKKDIHILLNNGSGDGVNDGYTGSITFGASNDVSYAGIYVQSSGSYGTRMIFGTTTSYSDGAYGRMIIDASGNVGIGTMSPSYKLDIVNDTDECTPALCISSSNNATWHYMAEALVSSLTQGQRALIGIGKSHDQYNEAHFGYEYNANSDLSNRIFIRFYSSPTDPFSIFADGKVCIGTTTHSAISNGDYKLRVNGDVYASGFRHSGANDDNYVITAGGGYKNWTTNNTASAIVARDSNGNISGARYYSEISDENINIGSVYIRNTTNNDNAIRRISFSDFCTKLNAQITSDDTISFTKSLKVTEAWMDTGITTETGTGKNFPKGTGTYIIQISHDDLGNDGKKSIYSGIITIFDGTNGTETEEIILHHTSAGATKRLYIRVIQVTNSSTQGHAKIQIAASSNWTASHNLIFKFRKLI